MTALGPDESHPQQHNEPQRQHSPELSHASFQVDSERLGLSLFRNYLSQQRCLLLDEGGLNQARTKYSDSIAALLSGNRSASLPIAQESAHYNFRIVAGGVSPEGACELLVLFEGPEQKRRSMVIPGPSAKSFELSQDEFGALVISCRDIDSSASSASAVALTHHVLVSPSLLQRELNAFESGDSTRLLGSLFRNSAKILFDEELTIATVEAARDSEALHRTYLVRTTDREQFIFSARSEAETGILLGLPPLRISHLFIPPPSKGPSESLIDRFTQAMMRQPGMSIHGPLESNPELIDTLGNFLRLLSPSNWPKDWSVEILQIAVESHSGKLHFFVGIHDGGVNYHIPNHDMSRWSKAEVFAGLSLISFPQEAAIDQSRFDKIPGIRRLRELLQRRQVKQSSHTLVVDSLVVPEQFLCERIQELLASPNDSFLTPAIKKTIQRQLQELGIQSSDLLFSEIEIATTPPGLSSTVHGLLCTHQFGRSLVTVQRGKYAGNLHPLESYRAVALFR